MEFIAAIVIGIIVIMSVNKMIDWNLEQRRTTNKEYEYKYGTPLNADLIKQSIKFNGFEPMVEDNSWYVFKIQGKDYYVCYRNIPYLQFYKRFEFNQSDPDFQIDLVKTAAYKINQDTLNGRIIFSDNPEEKHLAYQVFAVEMTYEHLCVSLMAYIRMLDDLIERHYNEYRNLIRERQKLDQSISSINEQAQCRVILS